MNIEVVGYNMFYEEKEEKYGRQSFVKLNGHEINGEGHGETRKRGMFESLKDLDRKLILARSEVQRLIEEMIIENDLNEIKDIDPNWLDDIKDSII